MNELAIVQRPTPLDKVFYALSDASPRTYRSRISALRAFAKWTKCAEPREAVEKFLALESPDAIHLVRLWRKSMLARGLFAASINSYTDALKKIVALANEQKIIDWSLSVRSMPENRNRDERLERCCFADYKRIQASITGNDRFAVRDRAIFRCLWDWALRRLEVVNLNVEDIDLKSGRFKLVGKGNVDPATYTFPRETLEAIKRWLDVRGHHPGPLFVGMDPVGNGGVKPLNPGSIWRIVRARGDDEGIQNLHPHAIRHAAATYLLENRKSLTDVSSLLRHSDPATTMRYFRRRKKAANRLAAVLARS